MFAARFRWKPAWKPSIQEELLWREKFFPPTPEVVWTRKLWVRLGQCMAVSSLSCKTALYDEQWSCRWCRWRGLGNSCTWPRCAQSVPQVISTHRWPCTFLDPPSLICLWDLKKFHCRSKNRMSEDIFVHRMERRWYRFYRCFWFQSVHTRSCYRRIPWQPLCRSYKAHLSDLFQYWGKIRGIKQLVIRLIESRRRS